VKGFNPKAIAKSAARIATAFLVFYILYLGAIWHFQRTLLYPGWSYPPEYSSQIPPEAERWTIDTADGKTDAIYLRSTRASKPAPAVIFFHGNGEFAEDAIAYVQHYRDFGYHVLIPEYRGFGGSTGEPGQGVIVEDVLLFIEKLKKRKEVDAAAIIYHGQSLGGGVATAVSSLQPPRALILESTFASVRELASRFLAPGILVKDPFNTIGALKELNVPILVMHGTMDPVIPVDHSRRNHATARHSKLWITKAQHRIFQSDEYREKIREHLRRAHIVDPIVR